MAWLGWRAVAGGLLPLLAGCALFGRAVPEPPEEAAARIGREGSIRAEVEARLAHEPSLRGGSLRVEVSRTDVHLHGTVEGYGALRCALATAGLARGVTLVVDYLVVVPGPGEVPCLAPRSIPSPRAVRLGGGRAFSVGTLSDLSRTAIVPCPSVCRAPSPPPSGPCSPSPAATRCAGA